MGRPWVRTLISVPLGLSAAGLGSQTPGADPCGEVLSRCSPRGGAHGRGARAKGRGCRAEGPAPCSLFP